METHAFRQAAGTGSTGHEDPRLIAPCPGQAEDRQKPYPETPKSLD